MPQHMVSDRTYGHLSQPDRSEIREQLQGQSLQSMRLFAFQTWAIVTSFCALRSLMAFQRTKGKEDGVIR